MDGKTVTVSKESLNQSEVKISGEGYTLKLADNVPTPVTKQFEWSLSDTTAKLSAGTSEGYTLDENTITYTKEISGKTLTSISGLRKGLTVVNGEIEGIKLDNDVITLSNKALSNKVSVSGEGYEFSFAADYGNSSISGSKGDEIIKVLGANITVTGGKGDDTQVAVKEMFLPTRRATETTLLQIFRRTINSKFPKARPTFQSKETMLLSKSVTVQ